MKSEVLLKTNDISVRIMELDAQEQNPWHYHSEVKDYMFCLEGQISVEQQHPTEKNTLKPGQHCEVTQGRIHRVMNPSSDPAKYLLIQGIGGYDFIEVNETKQLEAD